MLGTLYFILLIVVISVLLAGYNIAKSRYVVVIRRRFSEDVKIVKTGSFFNGCYNKVRKFKLGTNSLSRTVDFHGKIVTLYIKYTVIDPIKAFSCDMDIWLEIFLETMNNAVGKQSREEKRNFINSEESKKAEKRVLKYITPIAEVAGIEIMDISISEIPNNI